jgi:hypothetical protein
MQIYMNFRTLYEFLEIFNLVTDFGNGKRMKNIWPASIPRLRVIGLAQGSAPPKVAHNSQVGLVDGVAPAPMWSPCT